MPSFPLLLMPTASKEKQQYNTKQKRNKQNTATGKSTDKITIKFVGRVGVILMMLN